MRGTSAGIMYLHLTARPNTRQIPPFFVKLWYHWIACMLERALLLCDGSRAAMF